MLVRSPVTCSKDCCWPPCMAWLWDLHQSISRLILMRMISFKLFHLDQFGLSYGYGYASSMQTLYSKTAIYDHLLKRPDVCATEQVSHRINNYLSPQPKTGPLWRNATKPHEMTTIHWFGSWSCMKQVHFLQSENLKLGLKQSDQCILYHIVQLMIIHIFCVKCQAGFIFWSSGCPP